MRLFKTRRLHRLIAVYVVAVAVGVSAAVAAPHSTAIRVGAATLIRPMAPCTDVSAAARPTPSPRRHRPRPRPTRRSPPTSRG